VGAANADVEELTEVAQADLAGAVDAVGADAEVVGEASGCGACFDGDFEGSDGRVAAKRAVGAGLVVVDAEGIQLAL
jgi:hypothetical protein